MMVGLVIPVISEAFFRLVQAIPGLDMLSRGDFMMILMNISTMSCAMETLSLTNTEVQMARLKWMYSVPMRVTAHLAFGFFFVLAFYDDFPKSIPGLWESFAQQISFTVPVLSVMAYKFTKWFFITKYVPNIFYPFMIFGMMVSAVGILLLEYVCVRQSIFISKWFLFLKYLVWFIFILGVLVTGYLNAHDIAIFKT